MADCTTEDSLLKVNGTKDYSLNGSAHSSVSSGRSHRSRENGQTKDRGSPTSSITLSDHVVLSEESSTDRGPKSPISTKFDDLSGVTSRQILGPTQKKVMKNLSGSISEEEIILPIDGCLLFFTPDQMASFLRCLRIDDHVVKHLHRNGFDGKKFSKMKDSDFETVGIKNPVLSYFRDRSQKKRLPFML